MVVSRITGLLRVLVVGAVMGPTFLSNIFQGGYVLAANVYSVMAGPVLAMVVVPAIVNAVTEGGSRRADEVLGRICGRLLVVSTGCALALAAASPVLAWMLVFGMPGPERGRAWLLTMVLALFVAPQVVLYTIAGLGVAAQQARGRFGLPAAAPGVESLGTMLTVFLAARLFGTGLQVSQAPVAMMVFLGAGTTLSVVLHAGLQLVGAARVGLLPRPRRGWRDDPGAREPLRRIVKSVPVAASPMATMFLLTVVSSTVPGGVLVIQLSYQVFYGLSFVGARAVSTAALPRLAAAGGDETSFAAAWRQGLWYAVVVSLPSLWLLLVFAGPTADLLANGELRDSPVVGMLAACLAVVAVAQLVGGVHDLGRQALFSRLDHRGPLAAGYAATAAGAAVGLGALLLPVSGGRLATLAVAILAAELAGAVTVLSRLGGAIRTHRFLARRQAVTAAVGCAAMLPPIVGGVWLLGMLPAGRGVELAALCGIGALTLAAYAGALRLRRAPTAQNADRPEKSGGSEEPVAPRYPMR
jgi:peptidoglycan biosynthesis protein MviN/MurJ (putative lipid II flippase)